MITTVQQAMKSRVFRYGVLLAVLTSMLLQGAVCYANAESRTLTPLYDSVQVDINCGSGACTSGSIATNQMRKLVVSSTGVIYALFWNAGGIWVAKSTDRGASFSAPTLVTSTVTQGEIAISSTGTLYVSWIQSGDYKISKSTDAGVTWGGSVRMGSTRGSSNTLHMAVDGDNVYGFIQVGMELFVSTNAGSSWASKFLPYRAVSSADVHVDPLTHDIYVFRASPSVRWYSSNDEGTTWSVERDTSTDVDYLVSVFGSTGTANRLHGRRWYWTTPRETIGCFGSIRHGVCVSRQYHTLVGSRQLWQRHQR